MAQPSATLGLNNWATPDRAIFYLTDGALMDAGKVSLYIGDTLIPNTVGETSFAVDGGHFDGGIGVVPGLAAGASGTFRLVATKGDATGENTFTMATGSWDKNAVPPAAPTGPDLVLSASITAKSGPGPVIPEPSTVALGLLGAFALLLRRRS